MEHADQQSDMDNSPQHMHTPAYGTRRGGKKRLFLIIGLVVVVLAAGGGGYVLLAGKSEPKKTAAPAKTSESTTPKLSEAEASTPKTYKSAKLNIEFTYRTDWTLRESADKSEVILTSPSLTYQTKDGTSKQGVFTLKLRNGIVPDAMKPNIEGAVAVKDSVVIAYAAPSDQQRQYTNLSFGGSGTTMNFFIVTGSIAFKTGEAFGSNVDLQGSVYLFAGGYGSDPNDALAFDPVPTGSFETDAYKQAVAIVESLKIY